MRERFRNIPELSWTAQVAVGSGLPPPLPNTKTFILKKVVDCREKPKKMQTLMLVGTNGTHAFIYGPDDKLNEIRSKLIAQYIGKSWQELETISLN